MRTKDTLLIKMAISKLELKLRKLDVSSLDISAYNQRYLKDYIDNFYFFMPLYEQLLQKTIQKLSAPITQSSFIDYGGGCGILSFLAVELGFETVIYNDIYEVSTNDVKSIATTIDASIDHFVTGDIHQLVAYLKTHKCKVDVMSSFDVLEHIYDLKDWFSGVQQISKPFSICFMTSANASNPYIRRKLKRIHIKAEYEGSKRAASWKERDANRPFLAIRKEMIAHNFKDLSEDKILRLAQNTRGLFGEDIITACQKQIATGTYVAAIEHPTNTCDPYTGNWAEHCIDLKQLKKELSNSHTQVKFTNSFYSYSNHTFFNFPKYILNFLMKVFGRERLFLSPSYTLEIDYKK